MEKLTPGQMYFIVMFEDEDLKVPLVQTLIFVENRRRDDGSEFFLFRDLSARGEESKFMVDKKDAERLLLDQDGLLTKLKKCFDGTIGRLPR